MTSEAHRAFPSERDFLEFQEAAVDLASQSTDEFTSQSGEKLPASLNGLGAVLSLLYRAACCAWGCKGGDHQLEWLTGRVVNQGASAYRVIRAGYYDEALMLIRGIGELANLLWLFKAQPSEVEAWKISDRKQRMNNFGPGPVRKRLTKLEGIGPPISDERYRRLCEIGTHPVPGFAPGHFTGTGRPILGATLQPVGVFVCVTELSFAVAMCGVALAKLLLLEKTLADEIAQKSLALIRSLGAFTVLNYEELLAEAYRKERAAGAP